MPSEIKTFFNFVFLQKNPVSLCADIAEMNTLIPADLAILMESTVSTAKTVAFALHFVKML